MNWEYSRLSTAAVISLITLLEKMHTKKSTFDIQLHRDPRWKDDTISFSATKSEVLEDLLRQIFKSLDAFIGFWGVSGKGKDQDWKIVHLSEFCPNENRRKIVKAEQTSAPNAKSRGD